MADPTPANKAASTPENKTTAAKPATAKPTVYQLTTPDGRKYITTDLAEAEHLNRTRGYKLSK